MAHPSFVDPLQLVLATLAACALIALGVGGRLLALARRTGHTPELLLGCSVLCNGLGFVAFSLAVDTALVPEALRIPAITGGSFAIAVSAACVAVFTWRVFRPCGLGPLLFTGAIILMLGAGFINLLVIPEPAVARTGSPLYRVGLAGRILAYGWAAFESRRFTRMLQRRALLGLADASLTHRARMWTLAAGSMLASFLVVAASLAAGPGHTHTHALVVLYAGAGMLAAGALWLAFFPPSALLRRDPAAAAAPSETQSTGSEAVAGQAP